MTTLIISNNEINDIIKKLKSLEDSGFAFGVEHIPKEIKAFINNKNIITNIFRVQEYDSILYGYFSIGFIDFILARKTLTEYINLFSPNNFKKNDDITLNYFKSNI